MYAQTTASAEGEQQQLAQKYVAEKTGTLAAAPETGAQGHITLGMYDDGTPCEILITMAMGGSTMMTRNGNCYKCEKLPGD